MKHLAKEGIPVQSHIDLIPCSVTIMEGSGPAGDAIFSFVADICGEASEEETPPKHAVAFGNVGPLKRQMHQKGVAALSEFQREVSARNFPYAHTSIRMKEGEHIKFLEALDRWHPPRHMTLKDRL